MKVAIYLEDTPEGLLVKGLYAHNGCIDHLPDSVAALVGGNALLEIGRQRDQGLLKIIDAGFGRFEHPKSRLP